MATSTNSVHVLKARSSSVEFAGVFLLLVLTFLKALEFVGFTVMVATVTVVTIIIVIYSYGYFARNVIKKFFKSVGNFE